MTILATQGQTNGRRLVELDGLRGLAIILVVTFHFFVRWPELFPYGDRFADNLLLKYGYYGVHLFFMISGYVIFMSLDASKGLREFGLKRWVRLFPAMLVVTALVLATASIFPERPSGAPRLLDALPGITFIDSHWYRALGLDVNDLEGTFWSLYVEARFYIIVGSLYFLVGRRSAVVGLFAIALVTTILKVAVYGFGIESAVSLVYIAGQVLVGHFLFWFLLGIFTYLSGKGELGKWSPWLLIGTWGLAVLPLYRDPPQIIVATVLTMVFVSVAGHGRLKRLFRARVLTFFGLISYPLYLIHNDVGVALIVKAGKLSALPAVALPLLAMATVSTIAYFIAVFLEPRMQAYLKRSAMAQKVKSAAAPEGTKAHEAAVPARRDRAAKN